MADQLTDTVVIPGSGDATTGTAQPDRTVTLTADPRKEYAAGTAQWLATSPRAMPWSIDDLTDQYDDGVYERMLFDGVISSCLTIMKTAILEDNINLTPAVTDKTDPRYETAVQYHDFCERTLADLETPLFKVLDNICDALAVGNKVAEKVYGYDSTYTGKTQMVLQRIKVKPRHSTAFVVDAYRNVIGILTLEPGVASSLTGWGTLVLTPENQENLKPRDKFAILSWKPKDEDPRGTSILRPAYTAWALKITRVWDEYSKFLSQFATPVPIGFTDPDAEPYYDAQGNEITAAIAMANVLSNYRNGAAMTFSGKSRVETLFPGGRGDAFLSAIDKCNGEMAVAILGQTLAQGTGQMAHSRAATQVHERVTDTIVKDAKPWVEHMVNRDLCRDIVTWNWGKAAMSLAPVSSLGTTEPQDVANNVTAFAHAGYQLSPVQFGDVDELVGLERREADALLLDDPADSSDDDSSDDQQDDDADAGSGSTDDQQNDADDPDQDGDDDSDPADDTDDDGGKRRQPAHRGGKGGRD